MKTKNTFGLILFLLALGFCAANTSAQDDKKDEERLKQQPEILINADLEKTSAVIIKGMTEAKYDLEKEDNHQLVFRKKIGGATGFMAGVLAGRDAQNPHQLITFVMVKQDGGTLVSARAAILYPNSNNQGIPRNVDTKKVRKELWANLDEIKKLAEKQ
ncbi:MAG: hypothetical protein ACR2N3_18940 [Pyrinomonadaceae bacterium]